MRRWVFVLACGCYHRIPAQPIDASAGPDVAGDTKTRDSGLADAPPPSILLMNYISDFWNDTGAAMTLQYPGPQQAHDLNIVVVGWINTHSIAQIYDDAGNSYTAAGQADLNGMHQKLYFACDILATTGNVVHVTLDSSAQSDLRILEFSGIATTSCEDQIAASVGNATTDSSGSVTTTQAHELLFATNTSIGTTTGGDPTFAHAFLDTWPDVLEYEEVFATGTYKATATQESVNDWVMQIVSFRGQ